MSVEGEGSNEQKPQQQQQSQAQQNLVAQDLNFSINDILSNNHHDVNDSSFQSIVQTLSSNNNEEHIAPSYAHLPAELQDLFSNETDDLLSTTQGSNSDASFSMWNQQQQQSFVNSPQQQATVKPAQSPPQPASSTTLLDNITSQLPPEKKDNFIQLFRELQSGKVSAADFLLKAKSLLGQQQYQQLEDLKNKPNQLVQKPIASAAAPPAQVTSIRPMDDDRKRTPTSSQIRAEDTQRSMPGIITPQLKRAKIDPIPQQQSMLQQFHQQPIQTQQQLQQHLQMQLHQQIMQQQSLQPNNNQISVVLQQKQPIMPQQPLFKTPATPGLQIPTKTTNIPQSYSTSNKPQVSSSMPATTIGGGGDSRIDYDALTDVMGYAGVDLKEEAEHFMKDGDGPGGILPDGIDRSKMQDFMNTDMLRDRILKYAKCVDIQEIDGDFVSYLALAAQDRIRTIMESMVSASKHRTKNPFSKPPPEQEENGHPMFKIQVKQNVKLQLEAIQRVSRQTELDLDPPMDEEEEEVDEKNYGKGWYSKKSRKPLTITEQSHNNRKITVQDAIFVMERDVQGGRGTNQKTLLRAYNEWLS